MLGSTKKKLACIACCCVRTRVETNSPKAKLAMTKTRATPYSSSTLPVSGTSNTNRPSTSTAVICTIPTPMYGAILPSISSVFVIGVTMSCSSVPRSRSRTIAIAVTSTIVIVRITPTSPGTM